MKRIHYLFLAAAFLIASLASCNKNEQTSTLTISVESAEPATKTISALESASVENGCTVALYNSATGVLVASGRSTSTSQVEISPAPTVNCDVYALGNNTTYAWPSNKSGLSSLPVEFVISDPYVVTASRKDATNPAVTEKRYTVGDTYIKVPTDGLCKQLNIRPVIANGVKFVPESAHVTECPKILPFNEGGSTGTASSGNMDQASEVELTAFAEGGQITLYIPTDCNVKIEVTGSRYNKTGFLYQDTYTITVNYDSSKNRWIPGESDLKNLENIQKKDIELYLNGEDDTDVEADVVSTDTRRLVYRDELGNEISSLNVYAPLPGGTLKQYRFTVTPVDDDPTTNGFSDFNWTYDISWIGNTRIGATYLYKEVNGNIENQQFLAMDGSLTGLNASDGTQTFVIISTNNTTNPETVNLNATPSSGTTNGLTVTEQLAEGDYTFTINGSALVAKGFTASVYNSNSSIIGQINSSSSTVTFTGVNSYQQVYIKPQGTDNSLNNIQVDVVSCTNRTIGKYSKVNGWSDIATGLGTLTPVYAGSTNIIDISDETLNYTIVAYNEALDAYAIAESSVNGPLVPLLGYLRESGQDYTLLNYKKYGYVIGDLELLSSSEIISRYSSATGKTLTDIPATNLYKLATGASFFDVDYTVGLASCRLITDNTILYQVSPNVDFQKSFYEISMDDWQMFAGLVPHQDGITIIANRSKLSNNINLWYQAEAIDYKNTGIPYWNSFSRLPSNLKKQKMTNYVVGARMEKTSIAFAGDIGISSYNSFSIGTVTTAYGIYYIPLTGSSRIEDRIVLDLSSISLGNYQCAGLINAIKNNNKWY